MEMCRERTSYIRGRTFQTEIVSSIFSIPSPENLEGLIQELEQLQQQLNTPDNTTTDQAVLHDSSEEENDDLSLIEIMIISFFASVFAACFLFFYIKILIRITLDVIHFWL